MTKDSRFRKLVKEVSENLDIDTDIVDIVVRTQFKQIRDMIEGTDINDSSTFNTILIPRVGKFAVSEAKIKRLLRIKEEKSENNRS